MFIAVLLITVPNRKWPNILQWVNKQTGFHPHQGLMLSDKKKWNVDTGDSLYESQRYYAE